MKKTVIIVLGMHRSGTSLIAGVLNICGLFMGNKDELVSAGDGNEKGFFESKQVLEIDEEILKRNNGVWEDPPLLNVGWEENSKLKDLYTKADRFINKMDIQSDIWGIKEPRMCLTMPFWQKALKGREIKYIIPVRSESDVASSIHKRNSDISIYRGKYLWIRYWVNILNNTSKKNRYFTFFDNYFSDWNNELKQIIKFLNHNNITFDKRAIEIEKFISPDLRHHKSGKVTKLISEDNIYTWFNSRLNESLYEYGKKVQNELLRLNQNKIYDEDIIVQYKKEIKDVYKKLDKMNELIERMRPDYEKFQKIRQSIPWKVINKLRKPVKRKNKTSGSKS